MMNNEYLDYLRHCSKRAESGRGFVSPNPVVGALLVREGDIIAEDWHRKVGEGHAEKNLLDSLQRPVQADDLLVVSLEPCCHEGRTAPCTEAILQSGVKRVLVGLLDPNPKVAGKGVQILRDAGIEVQVLEEEREKLIAEWSESHQADVDLWSDGVEKEDNSKGQEASVSELLKLYEDLRWQNRFFFTWVTERRPWTALKIAQTLDGRVVPERGKQFWLTSETSRKHVHEQRSHFDAIMVGLGTVLADDPQLDFRLAMSNEQSSMINRKEPNVIILDAALTLPLEKKVVRPGTIIFSGRQFRKLASKKAQLEERGVKVLEVDTTPEGFLHLGQVLDELAAREITSLYVEGGAAVWSSFVKEGRADELMLYLAPKMLGAGVPSFEGLDFTQGKMLRFREVQVFEEDVFWNGVFT